MASKYFVLEHQDILNHLSEGERQMLLGIMQSIESGRKLSGEVKYPQYIVVPKEEPISGEVQQLLEQAGKWEGHQ